MQMFFDREGINQGHLCVGVAIRDHLEPLEISNTPLAESLASLAGL